MKLSKLIVALLVINSATLVCNQAFAGDSPAETKELISAENAMQQKDLAQALTDINQILDKDPNNIDALHKRVIVYMLMNQLEKARPDLDKLISLAKTPAEKASITSYKDSFFGQYKEAKTEIDTAVQLEPNNPEYYARRADILMQLDQLDAALQDANKALELNPNFFGAYYARARIYKRMGMTEKSQQDFQKAESLKASILDKKS